MLQLVRKLVFKFAIPDASPACTVTERISSLDHKFGYDAVEEYAVVVPAPREAYKVFDRLGGVLWEQAQVHVAQRGVNRRGGREHRRTRCSGWRGGGDRLFFAGRALVEDVSITRFRAAISVSRRPMGR
jgi:hypothetical protein